MRVYAILFLTMLRRSAFTLIEILIAVGMIAALATVVVVILNPAELAAQARDARRLTETSGLKQAITLISPKDWDGPNYQDSCAGEATPRIFVSVPSDNGEIPPALPPGWTSYVQVPRAASRAVDGTGWVPLDFRVAGDVGTTLPLGVLPVDPINTFASGYYYTYVCGANSYELSVGLQSSKFQKVMSEGGDDPAAFETGGSLSLAPPRSTVSCSASPPAVDIGENVTATGSGGNGTYSWAAPDGTPASGSGPTFLTSYNTTGTKAITVTSAGVNNVCPVAVSEGGVPLPAFDFTLTNNGNRTVSQGSSALETITAILASGTSEPVSFTASGLPLGASSSFSPTSCNPTCTSFLTLTAAATTPMGDSTVVVTGAAGSVTRTTSFTLTVTAPPADTQAPTVPANLTATAISSSQINLSWTASTDNVGVSGYRVYRGGVQIATTTATTYQNTGLAPSTTYTYTVSAYDAANNASAQSASASATTQAGGAAGAFIVDHTNLYLFDQIPEQYIVAAQNTPMMWVDRSVGANINEGLNCLEYESDELAPNSCKRNGTAPYDSPASELNWYRPGGYDRSNWVF
ncbi:MAG: Coagulation factor 5/8 type domain protein, partial [Parcubacteria group bacterium GW2011_GWB1_56_8]